MMDKRLRKTLESVWYSTGQAQFLMYGVWVIVLSGMFSLEGWWQLLATWWKLVGVLVFLATIWGSLRQKQLSILVCTITTVVVGAVYTSKGMSIGDVDIHRAATQSHYMVVVVLVTWGFYLANLCSRQMMAFEKMGIGDE
jgi:hypothetical protein